MHPHFDYRSHGFLRNSQTALRRPRQALNLSLSIACIDPKMMTDGYPAKFLEEMETNARCVRCSLHRWRNLRDAHPELGGIYTTFVAEVISSQSSNMTII